MRVYMSNKRIPEMAAGKMINTKPYIFKGTFSELNKIEESLEAEYKELPIETSDEYQIVASNPILYIPKYDVYVAPITALLRQDDEYEADWAGSAILRQEFGRLIPVRYEQDPAMIHMSNFDMPVEESDQVIAFNGVDMIEEVVFDLPQPELEYCF